MRDGSVQEDLALKEFDDYFYSKYKHRKYSLIYSYTGLIDCGEGEFIADLMEEGIRDGDKITIEL